MKTPFAQDFPFARTPSAMEIERVKRVISCRKVWGGEHGGWWCAMHRGMGVYAPTKEQAIEECLNVYFCGAWAHGDTIVV